MFEHLGRVDLTIGVGEEAPPEECEVNGDSQAGLDKAGEFLASDVFQDGVGFAKYICEEYGHQKFPKHLRLSAVFRNFSYTAHLATVKEEDPKRTLHLSWDLVHAPGFLARVILAEEILHSLGLFEEWLAHYYIDRFMVAGAKEVDTERWIQFYKDVQEAESHNIKPEELYLESLNLLRRLPAPGDTLSEFNIKEVIYRTYFSVVFLATYRQESIALKFMRTPQASAAELEEIEEGGLPASEEPYLWEIAFYKQFTKVLASRDFVPRIIDRQKISAKFPYVWLALEHLPGESLSHWLGRKENRSLGRAEGVFKNLLGAVKAVENRRWIAIDLKPLNIFVDESLNVCLLDFGSNRPFGYEKASSIEITPDYFDPDFLNHPYMALQHVYILGVILFEMATGNSEIHVDGKLYSFQEFHEEFGRMPGKDEIGKFLSREWLPYADVMASAIATPAEKRFVDTAALEQAFLTISAQNPQPLNKSEASAPA